MGKFNKVLKDKNKCPNNMWPKIRMTKRSKDGLYTAMELSEIGGFHRSTFTRRGFDTLPVKGTKNIRGKEINLYSLLDFKAMLEKADSVGNGKTGVFGKGMITNSWESLTQEDKKAFHKKFFGNEGKPLQVLNAQEMGERLIEAYREAPDKTEASKGIETLVLELLKVKRQTTPENWHKFLLDKIEFLEGDLEECKAKYENIKNKATDIINEKDVLLDSLKAEINSSREEIEALKTKAGKIIDKREAEIEHLQAELKAYKHPDYLRWNALNAYLRGEMLGQLTNSDKKPLSAFCKARKAIKTGFDEAKGTYYHRYYVGAVKEYVKQKFGSALL